MLISVRLYVQGEDLDPEEITRLLRVEPTRSHCRGTPRTLSDGRVALERIGVWVWKVGVDTPDAQLEDCLRQFVATFEPVAVHLNSLPHADSCWIDVHAVDEGPAEGHDSEVTLVLTAGHAQALGMFGLPIEISVSRVEQGCAG